MQQRSTQRRLWSQVRDVTHNSHVFPQGLCVGGVEACLRDAKSVVCVFFVCCSIKDPHHKDVQSPSVSSDSPGAGCVQPQGEHGEPTVQAKLKPSLESCALFGNRNLMTTSAHAQSLGS